MGAIKIALKLKLALLITGCSLGGILFFGSLYLFYLHKKNLKNYNEDLE